MKALHLYGETTAEADTRADLDAKAISTRSMHATPSSPYTDSLWLASRLDQIDPHVFDEGNDGAYTRALERLAVQLRDELATATSMVKARITNTASNTPPTPCTGSGCACRYKGQAYCEKHDS